MFASNKNQIPSGLIQKVEAFPGSLGGYIVVVTVNGVAHYAAFEDQLRMTQYMLVLLNREEMDKARDGARDGARVEAKPEVKAKAKTRRGRPKGSKNKPKVNGADHADVPGQEAQAAA